MYLVELSNLAWQYIFNALYTALWFTVLNLTLKKRFTWWVTIVIQLLWFFLYRFVSVQLPFMAEIRVVVFAVIFFSAALLCFKGPWAKVLFSSAAVCVVIITNELIGAALYFPKTVLQGNIDTLSTQQLIEFWGIYLLTGALLFFLLFVFLNRNIFSLAARDWCMFSLFPISQYALMFGWLDSVRLRGGEDKSPLFALAVFMCVFADIGLFAAIFRLAERGRLAAENDTLAAPIDAQEKHYQALTRQYENVRRMRHDIANHISAMQSLLSSGLEDDVRKYLEELNSNQIDSTLGMCKNPVVDAFLHNKIEQVQTAGVEISVSIDLGPDLPISNVDLIRIFGNLIDDCLENCRETKEPKLSILCSKAHGCLVIISKNNLGCNSPGKAGKKAVHETGIERPVLSDVAKKYNGSIRFIRDDNVFTTELVIGIGA